MTALFLSRISLRSEPSVATLAPILFDTAGRHRSEASRRLVWTLFADHEARTRDFLWREDAARRFYVLSQRAPHDRHQLFKVESKPFEPTLSVGERLVFSLRANATMTHARGAGTRAGKRDDVVMAALHAVIPGERVAVRDQLIGNEGRAWLHRQGASAGFEFDDAQVSVDGYEPTIIRGERSHALALTIMEFGGILTVRDPAVFVQKLAVGFGRGKVFGLGLMLVRRPS